MKRVAKIIPNEQIIKQCSCGMCYTSIPNNFLYNEAGVWWHCSCMSTVMIRTKNLLKILTSDRGQ